jgi:hypothetical protein
MRTVATWVAATLIGLVAVVGLIAFLNSRDQSGVDQHASVTSGPGRPYRGEPVLSPALEDAVRRGNVVVLYRDAQPPAGTTALIPPGGKVLVTAGQSVVLDRELAAVSAKKLEEADRPEQLQDFVDYWVGR